MADAPVPARDRPADRSGFAVASSAIPLGVQCRGCGRLLLPARLWPLAIRASTDGRTEVELRCVRCHAVGPLVLDHDDPDHRVLLAQWRDQRSSSETSAQNTGDGCST